VTLQAGRAGRAGDAAQAPAGAADVPGSVAEGRAGEAKPSGAISCLTGDRLDAATLYALLRLRAEVFVVEQACPYLDPDGLDLAPDTLHLWVADDGQPVAALRVVVDGSGTRRIGRVVTAASARGRGLASALVRRAVALVAPSPVVLDAQAHLEDWYQALGFVTTGPGFDDDGIPHVPMRRG
jgi:ElaA protein